MSIDNDARIQEAATDYGGWRWKVSTSTAMDSDGSYRQVRHITTGGDDNTIAVMDSDFDDPDRDADAIVNAHNRLPLYLAFVRAAMEELTYEISQSPKTRAAPDRIQAEQ